jgi:hypothetical protein
MVQAELEEYIRKMALPSGEEPDRFRKALGHEWEASQDLYEREHLGQLVSPEAIRRALIGLRLEPADYAEPLEAVARRLAKDLMFRRLWEHCWYLVYRSEPLDRWSTKQWQSFERCLGEQTGAFFLSVLLSHYDCLMGVVQARSIPMEIVEATLAQVTERVRQDTARAGRPGLVSGIYWLSNHLAGRIFRLGRLMNLPRPFDGELTFYHNRDTGKMIAVPHPGLRFRRDGQYDGAGGWSDPEGAWVTQLFKHGGTWVSNTWISHRGCARREEVRLDLTEWEVVLRPGDQSLEFHIPGGEPLDYTACGESFRRSLEFFAEHFPEIKPRAIYTGTWLLDPQLQDMLPPTANLVRFQREMYLYPLVYGKGNERHVLGSNYKTLDDAPRKTTLQRAIVGHLRAGGEMMAAGGILLADDVASGCWGTQRYRSAP